MAQSVKGLLYGGFMSLPLVLIAMVVFLAATLGNLGLIMLGVGHVLIVPLIAYIAPMIHEFFFPESEYFRVPNADVCNLIPSAPVVDKFITVAPSTWMAHVTFFFVFLFANASALYSREASVDADPNKVENRKAQAMTAMMLITAVFSGLLMLRLWYTQCETTVGILFGTALVAPIAVAWYEITSMCGARDADIFGILQKILPPNARDDPPMTCVYSP